jgi:two-component system, chemotaxis family, CheB/CheR fusion protein
MDPRHLRKIYDAVREPLVVLDAELRIRSANAPFYGIFNLVPADAEGRPIYELGNGEWDVPELRERLPEVLSTARPLERLELERDFLGLGRRTMLLNARPIDETDMILVGIEDITERRHQEERQKLLAAELGHRMKNMLATVQSIASQTARNAASISSFTENFSGRLQALGRAHALLTGSNWTGAPLGEVVREALQAYGAAAERIRIEGDDFDLEPSAALILSMIIYELATNAAKHGALSSASGRVEIAWQLVRAEFGPALRLTWQEQGGPPPTRPTATGFGTSLIEQGLAYELDGEARLDFLGTGLRCEMLIPYNPSNFHTG